MNMPLNAWFVGEGSLLIQAAATWLELGHRVAGIASRESSIKAWAREREILVIDRAQLLATAAKADFDFLFSVVNMVLLEDAVLRLPKKLAVNFHDGFLPRYAGVNAPVWALLHNEASHGVTWHEMTTGADEGRILVQRAFEIAADETAFSLNAKCFTAGIDTFRELAERITSGTLAPVPQNLAERNYFDFYDRPPHASVVGFNQPAEVLARTVRALDFGGYPNPIGVAKIVVENEPFVISGAEVLDTTSSASPGTVTAVNEESIVVATSTTDLSLVRLRTTGGTVLDKQALVAHGIREGSVLHALDAAILERLSEANGQAARAEGTFLRQLLTLEPLTFPLGTAFDSGPPRALESAVAVPSGVGGARLPALVLAFGARKSALSTFDVSYADKGLRDKTSGLPRVFANEIPLRIVISNEKPLSEALDAIEEARNKARARFPYLRDLIARQPQAPRELPSISLLVDATLDSALPTGDLAFVVDTATAALKLVGRSDRVEQRALERLARRLGLFIEQACAAAPDLPLGRVALVSSEEERLILGAWNATARPIPEDECLHTLFEAQARRTPDRTAVSARGRDVTYRELDRLANALAGKLQAEGVGPDVLVGVHVGRSVELLIAVLAIHKAGGAYVPLDPQYPADRISFMIEDSGLKVVVTDRDHASALPGEAYTRILVDDTSLGQGTDDRPHSKVKSAHLAYVIYTSGSTGKPKGVMVEQRNVVNFLCAMDDVLGHDPAASEPGTWLAVTSLSFDISVLELLWTLTRGLHVVVYSGEAQVSPRQKNLDFSLFYFSASESGGSPEDYRLLLDGARFADQNGFVAVWTPERHFHSFGGLYPNPSVTNAALAMITSRVALRAGSCVSPLHSPLRIAEEWAFVDNLSAGRVGISFASGWQPNDFAIRPDNFARRKEQMVEDIETVRRLWKGEKISFKSGTGADVAISTLPRPVQKELPIWITAAGTPETFEAAGRLGTHVLTHLLGQTFEEVAEKLRIYRAAWEKAGHPGRGIVTLMLHAFIGFDENTVKETVRGPMKQYLKSAVGLIKEAAWSFPTFRQKIDAGSFSLDKLSAEDMNAVLDHAFDRYYKTSGLFGTVDSALAVVDQVRRIDVDEIACLIDFGVPTDQVLSSLPLLAQLRERATRNVTAASGETIADLIGKYGVTHFQCTPSMASMLVLDDDARSGLARLDKMLVGGEALPLTLARQLKGMLKGALINVYGPTETTVWSSSHRLDAIDGEIPIGRPLANTDIMILDRAGGLVPPGDDGELVIGGKGVARGYLGREELTRERFTPHPIREGERIYRTGDLARFGDDGILRFIGRLDHQVKIRGYRIEIGEIEACLAENPGVRECVVIAREDTPGDKRIVAYVIPRSARPDPASLRAHLAARLPDYMLPSAFVFLTAFPETPNRKVDRKALPAPERQRSAPTSSGEAARTTTEEILASIWREALNVSEVGATDNFFDLGGHSLLTIQVLGKLRPKVARPLNLVDLFRYPTIRSLADFIDVPAESVRTLDGSAARGAERQRIRRAMVERRRGG